MGGNETTADGIKPLIKCD